jgi:hypothetical protein
MTLPRALARLALVTLLATRGDARGEAPPPPASPFLAAGDLSVEAESRSVRDLRLSIGAAGATLPEGSAAVVRGPDGAPVGLFLAGNGTFEYTSRDPREHPAVRYAVKKNTGLAPVSGDAGLVVKDSFRTLLWLASGVPLPELPGEASGPSLAAAFGKHRARFAKVEEPPFAHLLAAQRRDAPGRPLVRAEASGGGEDLVFVHDAFETERERLSTSGRLQLRVRWGDDRPWAILLAEQPLTGDLFAPPAPRAALAHVDLALTASGGNDAAISVTETFVARRGAVGTLLLHLLDTAESQTGSSVLQTELFGNIRRGRDRIQERPVRVTGVYDEEGRPLPFDHRHDQIAVALARPVPEGQSVRVRFEIEGGLLVRPLDNNYWILGTEPWFPVPDLAGQEFTARLTVRVKKPFKPIAPGTTVRRVEEAEFHVVETRLEKPVQFLTILAGAYAWDEETKDGVTLRVASYGGRNPTAFRSLLDLGFATVGFYEVFLGKMPVRELTIVELAAWAMGQAPAGLLLITSEAFNPMGKGPYRRSAAGVNERFAHELAHQWWGHGVRMPSFSEQWLSESFAEYCSAFFIRRAAGIQAYNLYLNRWRTRAAETRGSVPILLAHRLRAKGDQIQAERLRTQLLYDKGPLVLAAIHAEIGDEAFLNFLATVQATLGGKLGTTQRVEEVLEAVTQRDWTPFFDRFVRGTDIPEVPPAK